MKYWLKKEGRGKSYYYRIKTVSDKESKTLEKEGELVKDTRQEAQDFIRSKK